MGHVQQGVAGIRCLIGSRPLPEFGLQTRESRSMATAAAEDAIIKEPIDMLRLSLDDRVYVKCRCVQRDCLQRVEHCVHANFNELFKAPEVVRDTIYARAQSMRLGHSIGSSSIDVTLEVLRFAACVPLGPYSWSHLLM